MSMSKTALTIRQTRDTAVGCGERKSGAIWNGRITTRLASA
jgi:hypothetical protein